MRLIDADAFKKILSEHEMKHDKRRSFDDYAWGASNAYEHASDLLDEMPTVERPHGEWEACLDTEYCKCSYCGTVVMLEESVRFHFCPNCGADMRKEGDEK